MKDAAGVVRTSLKRGRGGMIVEERRQDGEGQPAVGDDGYHRRQVKRDAWGRPVEERYFDAKGFPVMSAGAGCYGLRHGNGPRGLRQGKRCLGPAGQPAADNQGVCGYTYSHDGRGCKTGQQNWTLRAGKCGRKSKAFRFEVDGQCGRLRKVCLTAGGKRTACGIRQAAEFRYRRDAWGQVVSTTHFRADHKPGKDTSCSAFEVRRTDDSNGNEVARAWFDVGGKPTDCRGTGFHRYLNVVDDAGRIVRRRFQDRAGKPTTNLGSAERRYTYDNYDHTVATEERGTDGKPSSGLGMTTKRYIYDAAHRNFGMLLFDAGGEPAAYKGCFTGQH